MKIPRDQWPQDFYARSQDYADNLYVAEIVKWDMVNAAMGIFFFIIWL